jgi:hypothetical protein
VIIDGPCRVFYDRMDKEFLIKRRRKFSVGWWIADDEAHILILTARTDGVGPATTHHSDSSLSRLLLLLIVGRMTSFSSIADDFRSTCTYIHYMQNRDRMIQ